MVENNRKENMNAAQWLGIIRHVLTFAGGFVVAKGWADDATVQTIIGALVTVAGGIWSALDQTKKTPGT